MDAPDVPEVVKEERAMRRRLFEVAGAERWVHHAADLDSGEIVTTPLDRPTTPQSRAERLSELGHRVDPAAFGWPSQRLTPRQPYQRSPEAWFSATRPHWCGPVGHFGDGAVWWSLPREFDVFTVGFGAAFRFDQPPVGRTVASITLYGYAYENTQSQVRLIAYGTTQGQSYLSVPVDRTFGAAVHTVDFTFLPADPPEYGLDIVMGLEPGIEEMAFAGISLGAEPPWIGPGPIQG